VIGCNAVSTISKRTNILNYSTCKSIEDIFRLKKKTERPVMIADSTRFYTMHLTQEVEPMARVPKVARKKMFLARGIHCCATFFFANLAIHYYEYIYEGVEIVYDYHYYQVMLQVSSLIYFL
jgi:hypothetical protein